MKWIIHGGTPIECQDFPFVCKSHVRKHINLHLSGSYRDDIRSSMIHPLLDFLTRIIATQPKQKITDNAEWAPISVTAGNLFFTGD